VRCQQQVARRAEGNAGELRSFALSGPDGNLRALPCHHGRVHAARAGATESVQQMLWHRSCLRAYACNSQMQLNALLAACLTVGEVSNSSAKPRCPLLRVYNCAARTSGCQCHSICGPSAGGMTCMCQHGGSAHFAAHRAALAAEAAAPCCVPPARAQACRAQVAEALRALHVRGPALQGAVRPCQGKRDSLHVDGMCKTSCGRPRLSAGAMVQR